MALFDEDLQRNCDVGALSICDIYRIATEHIRPVLDENPELQGQMLEIVNNRAAINANIDQKVQSLASTCRTGMMAADFKLRLQKRILQIQRVVQSTYHSPSSYEGGWRASNPEFAHRELLRNSLLVNSASRRSRAGRRSGGTRPSVHPSPFSLSASSSDSLDEKPKPQPVAGGGGGDDEAAATLQMRQRSVAACRLFGSAKVRSRCHLPRASHLSSRPAPSPLRPFSRPPGAAGGAVGACGAAAVGVQGGGCVVRAAARRERRRRRGGGEGGGSGRDRSRAGVALPLRSREHGAPRSAPRTPRQAPCRPTRPAAPRRSPRPGASPPPSAPLAAAAAATAHAARPAVAHLTTGSPQPLHPRAPHAAQASARHLAARDTARAAAPAAARRQPRMPRGGRAAPPAAACSSVLSTATAATSTGTSRSSAAMSHRQSLHRQLSRHRR